LQRFSRGSGTPHMRQRGVGRVTLVQEFVATGNVVHVCNRLAPQMTTAAARAAVGKWIFRLD